MLLLCALPLMATPVSSCDPNTFICSIYEGQLVPFGFLAVSGDVIVNNSHGVTFDVFRIYNDVVDTGGGTGIGDEGFLFGKHNLPDPSTYSVNAVFIPLGRASGGFFQTLYVANGDTYTLFTPVPEPASLGLLSTAALLGGRFLRRRSAERRG